MGRLDNKRPIQPKGAVPHRINDPNIEANFQDVMRQLREIQDIVPALSSVAYRFSPHPANGAKFQLSLSWLANRAVYLVAVDVSYVDGANQVTLPTIYTKDLEGITLDEQLTGKESFTITFLPFSQAEVDAQTSLPIQDLPAAEEASRTKTLSFSAPLIDSAQPPYFSTPKWTAVDRSADFSVKVNDPLAKGGTLRVWVGAGDASPNPANPHEKEITLGAAVEHTVDQTTAATDASFPLNDIPYAQNESKLIYLEYVTADGRSTGVQPFALSGKWTSLDPSGKIATAASFAAGITPVEIVAALPSTGNYTGRTVVLTTDGKLYRYNGAAWTAAVPATDLTGQITETQITDSAISTPKLAAEAVVSSKLYAGLVMADRIQSGNIATGAVVADHIDGNSGDFNFLYVNTKLVAANISAASLSAISANLGTITSGLMQNAGATIGLLLSGTRPVGWTSYLDFTATGAGALLKHGALELRADGTAVYNGDISDTSQFLSGVLPIERGGTGIDAYVAGVMIYADHNVHGDTLTPVVLKTVAKGSNGQFLSMTDGVPFWDTIQGTLPDPGTNEGYMLQVRSGVWNFSGFKFPVLIGGARQVLIADATNGAVWGDLVPGDVGAEPAFAKNTGFNKNLGTAAGTVAEGNHTHSYTLTDIGVPATVAAGRIPFDDGSGTWAMTTAGSVDQVLTRSGAGVIWSSIVPLPAASANNNRFLRTSASAWGESSYALPGGITQLNVDGKNVLIATSAGATAQVSWGSLVAADVGAQPANAGLDRISTPSTYGSIVMSGNTGGWAGIRFTGSYANQTLMVDSGAAQIQGFYNPDVGTWYWRFDNGALAVGTVPWSKLTSVPVYATRWPTAVEAGALSRITQTWITSDEGQNRFHFGANSHTYFGTATDYYFRSVNGTNLLGIYGAGGVSVFSGYLEVQAGDLRVNAGDLFLRQGGNNRIYAYDTLGNYRPLYLHASRAYFDSTPVTIIHPDEGLRLQATASGNLAVSYLRWYDSVGTALGYIGYATTSNSDLYIYAGAANDVRIDNSTHVLGELRTNGWFRNTTATVGLYNEALDNHFRAADVNYWDISVAAASTASGGLRFWSASLSAIKGYVYWTSSSFGLLDSAGSWRVRVTTADVSLEGNVFTSGILYTTGSIASNRSITVDTNWGIRWDSDANGVDYAIYREAGAWTHPYPDLVIGFHTGIKIGGHYTYGGTRFYNDAPGNVGATVLMRVGDGDQNVYVINSLYATTYYTTSALEAKQDIHTYTASALTLLRNTGIYYYRFKDDPAELRVGFIADWTDPLLSGLSQKHMKVETAIGVAFAALKEVDTELANLKQQIAELQNRISSIESGR